MGGCEVDFGGATPCRAEAESTRDHPSCFFFWFSEKWNPEKSPDTFFRIERKKRSQRF